MWVDQFVGLDFKCFGVAWFEGEEIVGEFCVGSLFGDPDPEGGFIGFERGGEGSIVGGG